MAATIALWVTGLLFLATGLFSLALIIAANVFDLKNAMWARPENPHTLLNVIIYTAIGAAAIVGARGSSKLRLGMAIAAGFAITASLLYKLFADGWS